MRSISYHEILWLEIEYGEYRAKCECCRSFRSCPDGIDLRAGYDHEVRQAVIDRIIDDKMSVPSVQACLERDFLLKLSTGYIYDALDWAVRQFDGRAFRQRVLTEFSGTMCVDEIHLGRRVLLVASDPVSDNPIAYAIVSSNDLKHMTRFLQNLKNHGFEPKTVVSDRSQLYPSAIETVWPQADHQLCVFHVIADINKLILDEVRDVRRELKPKRSKKKGKRGRPSRRQRAAIRRRQSKKAKADQLFRNRHCLVRRRSKMTAEEKQTLDELLALSPKLKTLRRFADDLHALFTLRRTSDQAWKIWRRLRRSSQYRAIPGLAKALDVLSKANMVKLLSYLKQPTAIRSKIRTNNHVERCNRKLRYLEKVRYKWRRSRRIIGHVLLQFQNWLKNKPVPA